jgi:hypothetical protein
MSENRGDAAGAPPDRAALMVEIERLQRVIGAACDPRVRDAAVTELRERQARLSQATPAIPVPGNRE